MGHWVTLDDDQHVYISDGGKVLASRSAISRGAPAKSRGKAKQQSVAGEIKTAQVVGRARTARAGKAGVIEAQNRMKVGHERMAKAKAILGSKINDTAYLKSMARDEAMNRTPGTKQWAAKEYLAGRGTVQDASYDLPREQIKANTQQSPSTARAIEHARAAGPGQAREMARSQFKVAEKIRTGKMADAALKARYAREDALKAKLNAPKPAAAPVRPKISEPPRSGRDAEGNIHIPDKQLGKAVCTGTSKEGMATFSWDKPSTARAIDHARAAGPSLREQAEKARAGKGGYDTRVKKIVGDLRTRAVAHQKASQDPTKPDRVILSEDVKFKRVVGRARKFAAGLKAKGHPAAK